MDTKRVIGIKETLARIGYHADIREFVKAAHALAVEEQCFVQCGQGGTITVSPESDLGAILAHENRRFCGYIDTVPWDAKPVTNAECLADLEKRRQKVADDLAKARQRWEEQKAKVSGISEARNGLYERDCDGPAWEYARITNPELFAQLGEQLKVEDRKATEYWNNVDRAFILFDRACADIIDFYQMNDEYGPVVGAKAQISAPDTKTLDDKAAVMDGADSPEMDDEYGPEVC